ncbi:MAG: hypothetical protein V1882_03060 [Candidatus Omnitrophota bacterium]
MTTITQKVIREIVADPFADPSATESVFILKHWLQYKEKHPKGEQSLNGNVFEALVEMTLKRKGITPFYKQASLSFVPNVNYDYMLYTVEYGPVSLSLKTSLRERYKQADLEALALKNIHRKSKSFLISLDERECILRKQKLADMMAIDDVIYAFSPAYDELLNSLKSLTITESPVVKVIASGKKIER